MSQTYLGIDIGGTHIRAISERDGARSELSHDKVAHDLEGLVNQIATLVYQHGATTTAITLPGRVWENRPVWVPNLAFLDGVDLVAKVRDKGATHEVLLINDAQAALIAEMSEGVAKGAKNVALVAIGTGIGGAVALNGELFLGNTGTAGSFGWLGASPTDGTSALTPGASGPWERAASGTALIEMTRQWDSVEDFVAALDAEDDRAVDAAEEFIKRLVGGFAAIASVFDPEKIIVVGGVSQVIEQLRLPIMLNMQILASPTGRAVEVIVGSLGPQAGTVGALLRAKGVKG